MKQEIELHRKTYEQLQETAIDLANELKVTKRTVLNYLQGKSLGYIKYGIKEIKYS